MSKSDKERYREQAQIKDQVNFSRTEQRAMEQNQKDREETENLLYYIKGLRKRLESSFRGVKKGVKKDKTPRGDVVNKIEESERNNKLMNKYGADVHMDVAKTFVNLNTITSYLPAETISEKTQKTVATAGSQIWKNWHIHHIESKEDAQQILTQHLNAYVDTGNKARGGRMIKSQEQTFLKKLTGSINGDDENQGSSSGVTDLF